MPKKRISDELAEKRRKNLTDLIERFGSISNLNRIMGRKVRDAAFSSIRNGNAQGNGQRRVLGTELARKIETCLQLPVGWMDRAHSKGEFRQIDVAGLVPKAAAAFSIEKYLLIPIKNAVIENGKVQMLETSHQPLVVARENLTGYAEPTQLIGCYWMGDSMNPIIRPGSLVVFDVSLKAKTELVDRALYLVRIFDELRLVRIQMDGNGSYIYLHSNPEYHDTIVPPEKMGEVSEIFGRALMLDYFLC